MAFGNEEFLKSFAKIRRAAFPRGSIATDAKNAPQATQLFRSTELAEFFDETRGIKHADIRIFEDFLRTRRLCHELFADPNFKAFRFHSTTNLPAKLTEWEIR